MALPPQVQLQLDQAESYLAQANAEPPPEVLEPAEVTAPVEPPAPLEPQKPTEDWQQKYRSLDGIIRSRDAKLSQVTSEVEQLRAELQRATEKPKPVVDDSKDVDLFGADLVEMVKRVAEQMFGSAAKALDDRMKAIEQKLEGTTGAVRQTAEDSFFTRFATLVPDWEAINSSQAWLTWLGEADPVYGVARQVALDSARSALDVNRVASIFNSFKGVQAPAPAKATQLDKQVAPRSAASAPVAAPNSTTITQAQVQAFYKDVAQGRYRGRDKDYEDMEREINTAMAEGRIK